MLVIINLLIIKIVKNSKKFIYFYYFQAIGGLDGLLGLFGKRSAEQQRFLDTLIQSLTDVINAVVMPAVNTSIQSIALLGAQITAGLSKLFLVLVNVEI